MSYLPNNMIANSWKNLIQQGNITNGFMGLLHIMRVIGTQTKNAIIPLQPYKIPAYLLSNSLQDTFFFGNNIKTYTNNEFYWITFSKNWRENVLHIFTKKGSTLNPLDVAIVCLNNYDFSGNNSIDYKDIFKVFTEQFTIDNETFNTWFDTTINYSSKHIQLENTQERQKIKDMIVSSLSLKSNENDTIGVEIISETILVNSNFFQNLYADQTSLQCLVCTKFDFFELYKNDIKIIQHISNLKTQNLIYFGCPGTGKSRRIESITNNSPHEKVTFHPEYDYASFVGTYKPFTDKDKKIIYKFVPQIFAKIYVEAWKNLTQTYYLIIEEINRGNCAAIFGDIFQLLDRDKEGFSQYFVHTDTDLSKYLEEELMGTQYEHQIQSLYFAKHQIPSSNPYSLLCLPNNLSILATMNTSDQSLFPMDSAFKRRWDWQYVPIDYTDAEKQIIEIGDKRYSWALFLRKINAKIYAITQSEDKQVGNRFVNSAQGIISAEVLINKVLFYLWFDVFRNENPKDKNYIFRKSDTSNLKYTDFFVDNGGFNHVILEDFLAYNEITF